MKHMSAIAVKSSDVRTNWSSFVDEVLYKAPKFVQRNERDIFLSMNLEMFALALENLRYKIFIEQDEEANEFVASSDQVWIVEAGSTEEEAIQRFHESYLEWAEDYFNEFNTNFSAPNTKAQFPYVLKALILGNATKLRANTDVEYQRP